MPQLPSIIILYTMETHVYNSLFCDRCMFKKLSACDTWTLYIHYRNIYMLVLFRPLRQLLNKCIKILRHYNKFSHKTPINLCIFGVLFCHICVILFLNLIYFFSFGDTMQYVFFFFFSFSSSTHVMCYKWNVGHVEWWKTNKTFSLLVVFFCV